MAGTLTIFPLGGACGLALPGGRPASRRVALLLRNGSGGEEQRAEVREDAWFGILTFVSSLSSYPRGAGEPPAEQGCGGLSPGG